MLHFWHIMLLLACLFYHLHHETNDLAFLVQFCVKISLTLCEEKKESRKQNYKFWLTFPVWWWFWFIHHTGNVRSNLMHCIVRHIHILANAVGHLGISCIWKMCISSMVYTSETVLCYSEQLQIPPRAAKSLFLKVKTIL